MDDDNLMSMSDDELRAALATIATVFSKYYDFGEELKQKSTLIKHTGFGGFADYGTGVGRKRAYIYDFGGPKGDKNKVIYERERGLLNDMWNDADMRSYTAEEPLGSGDVGHLGWILVKIIKDQ